MAEVASPPELNTEREVLEYVLGLVVGLFPAGWEAVPILEPQMGSQRMDAILRVIAPDGSTARLPVQAKVLLEPKTVPYALDQLRLSFDGPNDVPDAAPLLVARYLAKRGREMIAERGASYADATGNIRLTIDSPAVFLETSGATTNPWRVEREVRTLRGAPPARVVRALCDWRPPQTALEIAERAATSVGSVYRTLELLDREAVIVTRGKGLVLSVDVPGLIRRWCEDYDFLRRNRTATFIEPRGQERLMARLREQTSLNYAVTGSLGAATVAPYASAELLTLYVDDISEAAPALSLRPTASGANVILAEPFDPVVYARSTLRNGIKYCALSQVAADLFGGPGRNPSEADELLRWMESNERIWRL